MAHYQNEVLGVSFDIPDKITVRQQLAYRSAAGYPMNGQLARLESLWLGALEVLTGWQCAAIEKPNELNLDVETNPDVAAVITWAGVRALIHMNTLEEIPKAS